MWQHAAGNARERGSWGQKDGSVGCIEAAVCRFVISTTLGKAGEWVRTVSTVEYASVV